jgi:hypothetical protein
VSKIAVQLVDLLRPREEIVVGGVMLQLGVDVNKPTCVTTPPQTYGRVRVLVMNGGL